MPSASVFTWKVLLDKVARKDNLDIRGINLDNYMCALCKRDVEIANHLFFRCLISWVVWNLYYKWVGEITVPHISPQFSQFKSLRISKSENIAWDCMWMSLVSAMWRQKNNLVFKKASLDPIEIFAMCSKMYYYQILEE